MEKLLIEMSMGDLSMIYASVFSILIYKVFMGLVILDITSGIIKSIVLKKTNSTIGLNGLAKHGMVVLVVLMVTPFLNYLDLTTVALSFISFFIYNYTVSIVENCSQMGLPVPQVVTQFFDKLNDGETQIAMSDLKVTIKDSKEVIKKDNVKKEDE